MQRGAQQASEGCSSKAGPSWVLACLADHKPLHLIRFDLEGVLPSLPALMYVTPPASVILGECTRSFGRYSSGAPRAHEAGSLTYVRARKFGEPKKPPKLLQVSGGALTNVVRPPLLVCVPEELWQKPSPITPPPPITQSPSPLPSPLSPPSPSPLPSIPPHHRVHCRCRCH
jgi:hypothetical protein